MKRDLENLAKTKYDLLVLGGGIHGVFVALDASQRGLSVALIDQADFGGATSSNSLKTVHGGLRYLQDMDIGLVQRMIFERKTYLSIAPHLVHPLPFVVPTLPKLMRSLAAMRVALRLNDTIGWKRNEGQVKGRELPPSRILSKADCLQMLPGLDPAGITGGALWYDAQIFNTERFLLSVLQSAVALGATAANYVKAAKIVVQGGKAVGADVVDQISGDQFHIQADCVVNAAGAWIDQLIPGRDSSSTPASGYPLTVAWNIVTRKFIDGCAAGIFGENKKLYFIAPWRTYSIAGTVHESLDGSPEDHHLPEEKINTFITELNSAYGGAQLTLDDVRMVHRGFHHVKTIQEDGANPKIKSLRRGVVINHAKEDGVAGLVSLVSVKFTTARAVAEEAVDLVCAQSAQTTRPCASHSTPILGGDMSDFDQFMTRSSDQYGGKVPQEFFYTYGTRHHAVLTDLTEYSLENLFRAKVNYAVRHEMALRISDVLLRRLDSGSGEWPSNDEVEQCAKIMGDELGWSAVQKQAALDEFEQEMLARWPLKTHQRINSSREKVEQ